MRLVAACAGSCAPIRTPAGDQPAELLSAIDKRAMSTLDSRLPVEVGASGLVPDQQADREHHGGPRRAVYVYPHEHYAFWRTVRMQAGVHSPLSPGALGENLLIEGLLEPAAWIGDLLKIGEVEMRIEGPRKPGFKLDAHLGFSWAGKMMLQSGFTGFFCSVVTAGRLCAGDPLTVRAGDRITTIAEAQRLGRPAGHVVRF
jgi:MOSC domain-containing protein YiiM